MWPIKFLLIQSNNYSWILYVDRLLHAVPSVWTINASRQHFRIQYPKTHLEILVQLKWVNQFQKQKTITSLCGPHRKNCKIGSIKFVDDVSKEKSIAQSCWRNSFRCYLNFRLHYWQCFSSLHIHILRKLVYHLLGRAEFWPDSALLMWEESMQMYTPRSNYCRLAIFNKNERCNAQLF